MKKNIFSLSVFLVLSFMIYGQNNQWVWMKGDSNINNTINGKYGTLGVSGAANRPGSRSNAATWTDASGNFWLFGGDGFGESGYTGYLNDLWKYNPVTNQWTWMKGDKTRNVFGVYGSVTVSSSTNKPGSRKGAVSWNDTEGNLWLFGGEGYGETYGYPYLLNDLWKYNSSTNEWTWMKGDKITGSYGIYGTINVSAVTNKPGCRGGAVSWKDGSGNFWLLGGDGRGESTSGYLNDLWKYNTSINEWTWIKGDKAANVSGVYGTQGTPLFATKPGGRKNAVSWSDTNNNLWLFGGDGRSESSFGYLNDLWKYNISTNQWTWMKGDNIPYVNGIYGTQGTASSLNKPGSREGSTAWNDGNGNLFLFGGFGYDESSSSYLNDLWKYNLSANQWTWVKGDKISTNETVYGIQGIAATANKPGGRRSVSAWLDATGNVWIFGGYYYTNEVWKYNSSTNQWAWMRDYNLTGYPGVYGTKEVASSNNKPGSRNGALTWKDAGGNFWLFGGNGNGGLFAKGLLNDLWKFDITTQQWIWMKGDSTAGNNGIYGILNTASATNKPGARSNAVTWTDPGGNLWLFGGNGYPESGNSGYLNDLWKYNTSTNQWTWMKGDKTVYVQGIYGSQGNSSATNKPGSRTNAFSWTDASGALWLFGGDGYSESGYGYLNDLWKYNTSNNQWTWQKGDKNPDIRGIHGVKNTAAVANKPASRYGSIGWRDNSNNLWLFGGYGFGNADSGSASSGYLNDLWKYSTATNNWTWVSGDKFIDIYDEYGFQGVPGNSTRPGGRSQSTGWLDQTGSLWLFGGQRSGAYYNDLWKFNPVTSKWAWVKGSSGSANATGNYGTQGVSSANNNPGSRYAASAFAANTGDFWLFGGYGYGTASYTEEGLNDLWTLSPCTAELTLTSPTGSFCNGVTSILLTASGGSSYEWFKNGILIPGQSNANYTATTPGTYYAKSVSGSCNLFSNEITLTPATIPPSLGGTGIYCEGDAVNVGIPQTELAQNYTWNKDGISVYGPIGGNGGNQSLNFDMVAGMEGTYIVQSTKAGCENVFSNTVFVGFARINNLVITNKCSDRVSFRWDKVAPDTIVQKYEYKVSLSADPDDNSGTETSTNIGTVTSLTPSTLYYIHIRSGCGFGLFYFGDWTTLSFATPVTSTTGSVTPSSATICTGGSQSLTATGGTAYQWLLNSNAISGATSSAYTATAAGTYNAIITNGTCSVQSNNAVITVISLAPGTAEWIGVANNVWSNAANWKCGLVPVSTTAVIINGGMSNYPAITSNLTLKTLTVNAGASIQVNPGVVVTVTGL